MAGWSGFTDEELHRLKNSSEASLVEKQKRQNAGQHSIPQHSSTTGNEQRIRPQHRRKMPLKQDGVAKQNKKDLNSKSADEIGNPDNISIDRKEDEVLCEKQEGNNTSQSPHSDCKANTGHVIPIYDTKEKEEPDLKLIPDEDLVELELNNLEKLQKKQKEIEEENRKKKQIINETISQRYKKAQSEASTLQSIQKELVKLDCLLAKDVEILRTKIEEATSHFSSAQKRYAKAEQEYVSAKLDLKLKSDKKDELTQHLFTIIQENELRKSKKLEELLSKLNLAEDQTGASSVKS